MHPPDLLVVALERICRMRSPTLLAWKAHVGRYVFSGALEELGGIRRLGP
jgi:hypothetical protein